MTGNIVSQCAGSETMKRLEFYPNGIRWTHVGTLTCKRQRRPRIVAKRGKVKGFSVAAARRLREVLLTHYVPDAQCFNLTLTLGGRIAFKKLRMLKGQPGVRGDGCLLREYWMQDHIRANWLKGLDTFFHAMQRAFPNSVLVWRVEMQSDHNSGAPHLHTSFWVPFSEDVGNVDEGKRDTRTNAIASTVCHLWMRAMSNALYRSGRLLTPETKGFWEKRAIDMKELHTDASGHWSAAFRYMCSHSGKHKESQLGWQGRQWGIVNRKAFVEYKPQAVELLRFHEVQLKRLFRRMRFKVVEKPGVPFGTKKSPTRARGTRVQFLEGTTAEALQRAKSWLLEHYPPRDVRDSQYLTNADVALFV